MRRPSGDHAAPLASKSPLAIARALPEPSAGTTNTRDGRSLIQPDAVEPREQPLDAPRRHVLLLARLPRRAVALGVGIARDEREVGAVGRPLELARLRRAARTRRGARRRRRRRRCATRSPRRHRRADALRTRSACRRATSARHRRRRSRRRSAAPAAEPSTARDPDARAVAVVLEVDALHRRTRCATRRARAGVRKERRSRPTSSGSNPSIVGRYQRDRARSTNGTAFVRVPRAFP